MTRKLQFQSREITLHRYGTDVEDDLLAWNAADEHILKYLEEQPDEIGSPDGSVLVINDAYGALTLALDDRKPHVLTDSQVSVAAIGRNRVANGMSEDAHAILSSTTKPKEFPARYDLVLMKIPKSLALLDYQIQQIKSAVGEGTKFIAAGMTKHLAPSTRAVFEEKLGPTQVTRVYKKSILFLVEPQKLETDESSLEPAWYTDEELEMRVCSYPGVFSQARLDNGTRLLIAHLPATEAFAEPGRIVDLGCGSGVLGAAAARKYPGAKLRLVDESHLAVASARRTFEENGLPMPEFLVADGVTQLEAGSADLVLSNPPFHANQAFSRAEAIRHFRPVEALLDPEGEFRLVGANGVEYRPILSRSFGSVRRLVSNKKYTVFGCRSRRALSRAEADTNPPAQP